MPFWKLTTAAEQGSVEFRPKGSTIAWKTSCKLPLNCSSFFQLPNSTGRFTRRYFPMLSLSETNFLNAQIGWWWAGYKIWERITWASLAWLVTNFPLIQCQNQENLRSNAARNITRNNISRRKIDLPLLIKNEHTPKEVLQQYFLKEHLRLQTCLLLMISSLWSSGTSRHIDERNWSN